MLLEKTNKGGKRCLEACGSYLCTPKQHTQRPAHTEEHPQHTTQGPLAAPQGDVGWGLQAATLLPWQFAAGGRHCCAHVYYDLAPGKSCRRRQPISATKLT